MAYVITKRPVDVIEHTLDFTGYLAEAGSVSSATVDVVGEGEATPDLTADVAVASPLVTVTLSGGTALGIYQVYVTATLSGGLTKRLQFEVQVGYDDVPMSGGI